MKIKCRPEDFRVVERTETVPDRGPFALYRLTKRSLGTPEAIDRVLHRWQVPRERISYGGLKDRHALTAQHLTIWQGPQRGCRDDQIDVEYLGQVAQPFVANQISANHFEIVVRHLTPQQLEPLLRGVEGLRVVGWPNYFDEQRFGSLGQSGEFMARPWCRGDWERALWLALADPNRHDRPAERQQKQLLRDRWNHWAELKSRLPRSSLRSTVTYLVDHPTDYRGAIARLRQDMRSLYLAAYQSFLWNRWLSTVWQNWPGVESRWLQSPCGPLAWPYRGLSASDKLDELKLPLPSARIKLDGHPHEAALSQVLQQEGLALREIRVKYPRDSFFSKGLRAAMVVPDRLVVRETSDELYPRYRALTMSFDLPRGAYATMGLKCLQSFDADSAGEPLEDEESAERLEDDSSETLA